MDPNFGYKGAVCPVTNCYMRGSNGDCVATKQEDSKPTSKLMRDAIVVVEIIEAARNAPSYAEFTTVTHVNDPKFDNFIKEADISRARLQFVLNQHQYWLITMQNLVREPSEV